MPAQFSSPGISGGDVQQAYGGGFGAFVNALLQSQQQAQQMQAQKQQMAQQAILGQQEQQMNALNIAAAQREAMNVFDPSQIPGFEGLGSGISLPRTTQGYDTMDRIIKSKFPDDWRQADDWAVLRATGTPEQKAEVDKQLRELQAKDPARYNRVNYAMDAIKQNDPYLHYGAMSNIETQKQKGREALANIRGNFSVQIQESKNRLASQLSADKWAMFLKKEDQQYLEFEQRMAQGNEKLALDAWWKGEQDKFKVAGLNIQQHMALVNEEYKQFQEGLQKWKSENPLGAVGGQSTGSMPSINITVNGQQSNLSPTSPPPVGGSGGSGGNDLASIGAKITGTMSPLKSLAIQTAIRNGVDPNLMLAAIDGESGWNPTAVGDNGTSFGLGQIHLPDHPDFNVNKAKSGPQGIQYQLDYVAQLLKGKTPEEASYTFHALYNKWGIGKSGNAQPSAKNTNTQPKPATPKPAKPNHSAVVKAGKERIAKAAKEKDLKSLKQQESDIRQYVKGKKLSAEEAKELLADIDNAKKELLKNEKPKDTGGLGQPGSPMRSVSNFFTQGSKPQFSASDK